MYRTSIIVASRELNPLELVYQLGREPDHFSTADGINLWTLRIEPPEATRIEYFGPTLAALGDDLADRIAVLCGAGRATAVWAIRQDLLNYDDPWETGIAIELDAIGWLARAGAGIRIDQTLPPLPDPA